MAAPVTFGLTKGIQQKGLETGILQAKRRDYVLNTTDVTK